MGIRKFVMVWQGQLVSTIGSGLVSFALGVWIYQKTGSATLYGLVILLATLPGILINPIAGVIADRLNRRTVIMLSDFGACLGSIFIALMIWTDRWEFWHICVGLCFSSLWSGIQAPAYQAMISQLVPRSFYAQASGMVQIAASAGLLVSPLLAGALFGVVGLNGIFVIDFVSFLYAIISTFAIPRFEPSKTEAGEGWLALFQSQIASGFQYLKERTELVALTLILFLTNFLFGFLIVLIGPMMLSFATPQDLGLGESISGIGMLLGSIGIAVFGAPRRRIKWLFILMGITGFCYAFIGVRANFFTIVIPCFIFFFNVPLLNVCTDTLLRNRVAPEMQGRVYAFSGMINQGGMVLSYLVAGPLADRVFEPLMQKTGPLADTIGRLIGVGPGRGIGLVFIIAGFFLMIVAVLGYLWPRIRMMEIDTENLDEGRG